MINKKYKEAWLMFVNVKAKPGLVFSDLVENNDKNHTYVGAWANIIVLSKDIKEALSIAPLGLDELGFEIDFIDKIENILSLIEYEEIDDSVLEEVDWLLSSEYVFKISDALFPYENDSENIDL